MSGRPGWKRLAAALTAVVLSAGCSSSWDEAERHAVELARRSAARADQLALVVRSNPGLAVNQPLPDELSGQVAGSDKVRVAVSSWTQEPAQPLVLRAAIDARGEAQEWLGSTTSAVARLCIEVTSSASSGSTTRDAPCDPNLPASMGLGNVDVVTALSG